MSHDGTPASWIPTVAVFASYIPHDAPPMLTPGSTLVTLAELIGTTPRPRLEATPIVTCPCILASSGVPSGAPINGGTPTFRNRAARGSSRRSIG